MRKLFEYIMTMFVYVSFWLIICLQVWWLFVR